MRKLLLSLTTVFVMTGLVVAAEVTLVKFDADTKEVTVKEGNVEKVYKITDKTKFVSVDKDGNTKELKYENAIKGLGNPKAAGRLKFEITTDKDVITEAKLKGRKGK
ncbi:MAG: hypothetical protein L0241_15490 [Planctomycetia bacterium]|nr:hypothetical protein [Planctomycetia bacterium]